MPVWGYVKKKNCQPTADQVNIKKIPSQCPKEQTVNVGLYTGCMGGVGDLKSSTDWS